MVIFLERTDTIADEEKQKIWKVLKMLDKLWDESPRVQQVLAKGRAEGKAEGRAEGQLEGLRVSIVTVVAARFPTLAEDAQQRITKVNTLDVLRLLLEQISTAPNEEVARWLLQNSIK